MFKERYLRHSLIDWFDQEKVFNSYVIVVGAGAIGNELIKNLALVGVGKIHIVDFDVIEIHNLTRSVLFHPKDVGKNKAEIAAKVAKEINEDSEVTYSNENFWKTLSISEIKKADAVFCCVDNFEARLKLNRLCYIAKTDFYNSGIDSRFVSVEMYPFSKDNLSACYECNLTPTVYKRVSERYSCGWLHKIAYEEKKIPTTIITSSIAAANLLSLFLQANHPESFSGSVRIFNDSITLTNSVVHQSKNPDCPNCHMSGNEFYIATAKRNILSLNELAYSIDGNQLIELSDPLILTICCKQCGETKVINDIASNYDESITICDNCRLHSMDVDIVESLTFNKIKEIKLLNLPVKFLSIKNNQLNLIIELE